MANAGEVLNSGVIIAAIGVVGAWLASRGKTQHNEQNEKLDKLVRGQEGLMAQDVEHNEKIKKVNKQLKDHGRRIEQIESRPQLETGKES